MIAIAVDDEQFVLKALKKAIQASQDIRSVTEFSSCTRALEWVRDNPVDVAFLDINMRGMDGLQLARRIQEFRPDCRIIFCTGYAEYAVSAFQLHVSGYLLKPVTAQAVQKEIDHIKGLHNANKLLTVKCFGDFEVYAGGKPVYFRRGRTKELFAFLVDRNGAGVTSKQICAKMWEEDTNDEKKMDYLRQLFADLRRSLSEVGAEQVLIKSGIKHSVDTSLLDCDYIRYCASGVPPFRGEYMTQYSWAEETCALLWKHE